MFKLDASASIRALENGKQGFFKDQAPWPIAILVAGLLLMLAAKRYSRIFDGAPPPAAGRTVHCNSGLPLSLFLSEPAGK